MSGEFSNKSYDPSHLLPSTCTERSEAIHSLTDFTFRPSLLLQDTDKISSFSIREISSTSSSSSHIYETGGGSSIIAQKMGIDIKTLTAGQDATLAFIDEFFSWQDKEVQAAIHSESCIDRALILRPFAGMLWYTLCISSLVRILCCHRRISFFACTTTILYRIRDRYSGIPGYLVLL